MLKKEIMKKILVLCTGNSCRSQMAEGYLRFFADGKAEIYSAGIIAHGVNPRAIQSMKEDGIDISVHTSNKVDDYLAIDFDFVITVCDNANELCPIFPSKAKKFHQNFYDPSWHIGSEEEITASFNSVRNEIKAYCHNFVSENL